MAQGFDDLTVWQKAHHLMLFIHKEVVPQLPHEEKWDLTQQIRRASKSVPSNIAEGYGRFYYRDTVRFCYNARGSLCETENHLIAARDLAYVSHELYQHSRDLSCEVQRLLNGYIAYLKRQKPGQNEPGHDVIIDSPTPDPDSHLAPPDP